MSYWPDPGHPEHSVPNLPTLSAGVDSMWLCRLSVSFLTTFVLLFSPSVPTPGK